MRATFLSVIVLLLCLPLAAQAGVEKAAQWRSVWLNASQFPDSVIGQSLDDLSLAAWDGDHFKPIPFQFDEVNTLGLVDFSNYKLAPNDGKEDVFDGHDLLGFMWRDSGKKVPVDKKPDQGKILADISVSFPRLPTRHVYLLRGNDKRSGQSYVHQNIKSGKTRTSRYELSVNPDNEIDWRNFSFDGYSGKGSIIRQLRMRMSARMLSRFSPRITLDNSNLKPHLLASKSGPIRTTMLLKIHVVFMHIPVMTVYEQVSRYAAKYQAITYTRIPSLYRTTLKSPHVAVSFVGNDLMGATLQTALSKGETVKVDGKMTKKEKHLLEGGINNRHNWIFFNSKRRFILMAYMDIPTYLRKVPVSLVYDDRNGGKYAPLLPNVGYDIKAWPKEKKLLFGLNLLFDNSTHQLTPIEYLGIRAGTPRVSIDGNKDSGKKAEED